MKTQCFWISLNLPLIFSQHAYRNKKTLLVRLKDTSNLNTKWLLCKLKLMKQNRIRTFSTWFQPVKRSAQELTCAGIVIDPDVARMADAHEGARGVNAHGVLPAVVLPFGALINIWREGREKERGKAWVSCGLPLHFSLFSLFFHFYSCFHNYIQIRNICW